MSQAVYCPQCPGQLFPVSRAGQSETVHNTQKIIKNLFEQIVESTIDGISRLCFGKDVASVRIVLDALNEAFDRVNSEDGEAFEISRQALRDAITVLVLLPKEIPLPIVEIEDSGDILLEWYKDPWNLFSIIIDGTGKAYYAGLFGGQDDRDRGVKPIGTKLDDRITTLINEVI